MKARGSLISIRRTGADESGVAADRLTVEDVMERDVVPVTPQTLLRQAAWILVQHELAGVPVLDMHDRLVGVLDEHDLMARLAPRRRRPWWRVFADPDQQARAYRRAVAVTVADLMSPPVVTASPTMPVHSAALLFEGARVGIIPVVEDGRLVGTLSRRDLIERLINAPPEPARRSDAELVAEMQARMATEPWCPSPCPRPCAEDGVLLLYGCVDSEAQKAALEAMARAVPGCRRVESHLLALNALPYSGI
jgi:CBS-domain-containing membrane protein